MPKGNTKHQIPKNTPWKNHCPGLFKKKNEPYNDYIREGHDKRIQKSLHKSNAGQGLKPL